MFIVQVIPLSKSPNLESLTYYASREYPIGTLLSIPVRGKEIPGLVTESKPVTAAKSSVRSAQYTLRKLTAQPDAGTVPKSLIAIATNLSKQYPASIGSLLYHLLPPDIKNGTRTYPNTESFTQSEDPTPQLLTARRDERIVHYQSHIRETFAHRGSVLVVAPTAITAKVLATELSSGISDRLISIIPSQTKKERDAAFTAMADTSQARLIVTTPQYAFFERVDLLSIIIEQAASGHYHANTRPYIDYRRALCEFAKETKRTIICGDTVPLVEHETKRREDIFTTAHTEVKRLAFPAALTIITQKDKPKPDIPFQLFSDRLVTTMTRLLEGRGHIFLYGARRGLAPVVTCIDCGHIFRCPDSMTPYSLLRTYDGQEEKRWFVSSTSGARVPAADICPSCGSWRLRERGIGIQQVYDEWQTAVPDYPAILLDQTTARTGRQVENVMKEFYDHPAAVLISTQLALPYLTPGVTASAVVSLDAARAIPSWRADEQLFRLLITLREISDKEVLVQTRTETDNLLTYAARGALERFYDDEISLRSMLGYPPNTKMILLTWVSKKSTQQFEAALPDVLKDFSPQLYTNPQSTPKKIFKHCLLRIDIRETEQYQKALTAVRQVPPFVKIEVDPDRIV
jgi:primosomal protein N'